jgi:bacitracin transport system permease protein
MIFANLITGSAMTFEKFAGNIHQMNFSILDIILFSLISAFVFSREFTDKTANILYTYPISRMKIFISKLITVYILIFFVYFIQCISIYLSYYIANGIIPSRILIMNDIKANMVSILFQFLLVPIPILIANVTRNIMMPLVYGILCFITSGFIGSSSPYAEYIPFMVPQISALYFYFPKNINFNFNHGIIYSTLCFMVFMFISIFEFNKKDID